MALAKRSHCSACIPVPHWSEFLKILYRGDVGITIYRYRGPAYDERGQSTKTKETFIFYTTSKVTDCCGGMGLDIHTAKPKCIDYCPRCIAMTQKIETLFRDVPSDGEADLYEIFSCPPCSDLVHKFRRFTAKADVIKERDSEIIHLHRLTSSNDDDADKCTARTKFENLVQSQAKDNELTRKEGAKDKHIKTKTTKIPKILDKGSKDAAKIPKILDKGSKDAAKIPKILDKGSKDAAGAIKKKERRKKESANDEDLKTKSTEAQKTPGRSSQDLKTKSLGKMSKDKKIKSGDKTASSSKVGNLDSEKGGKSRKSKSESKLSTKPSKAQSIKSKSTSKLERSTADRRALTLIRQKIIEHLREQAKQEHAQRAHTLELLKHRQDIDSKLDRAAKQEEQARRARILAEQARQLKFKAAMKNPGPLETSESQDLTTDVCSDETIIDYIIKGNKLCKASKADAEEPIIAPPAITAQASLKLPPLPPPTPCSNSKTPPGQCSISRQFHDGCLKINLSERKYIEKGWTLLPKEMIMRKITLFDMHPARNEFDWLEMNRHKQSVLYDTGEQLATFDENGCSRVYYRSGVLALDFYQAQEKNAGGYRVVVYSNGKPVERGRAPIHTVLATFDYGGNGEVFDHNGKPRLKYTQNEGVVLDQSIGPYTHWKWHNLNNSSLFQTVLIENEPINKDPIIMSLGKDDLQVPQKRVLEKLPHNPSQDEKSIKTEHGSQKSYDPFVDNEMLMRTIEAQNIIKENYKRLKGFSPYQIKMKAFKINENFSLRIIEQSSVFLTFNDGKTRLRINVGMVLDPTEIVGQDLVEVGEVASTLGKMPASESVEELQRVVRGARSTERARLLREKRIKRSLE